MSEQTTEPIIRIDLTVSERVSGLRIDQILARTYLQFSRNRLQQAIKSGDVLLNGQTVKAKTRAFHDDVISGIVTNETEVTDKPQNIALHVVYADDDIIVIDKPAGLVVHPAPGHRDGTVLNALLYHFPDTRTLPRGGIVHRLDKDTSGLMVIAHNEQAHTRLVRQLHSRTMGRHYLALVHGHLIAGGTIDLPIGRHPRERVKMAVRPDGKPAITHFSIAKRFATMTLLRVRLETGRTHQIRVHMSERHHPLVGDKLYGSNKTLPAQLAEPIRALISAFPRQALHAQMLVLTHPKKGKALEFYAPLPPDIETLLDRLDTAS